MKMVPIALLSLFLVNTVCVAQTGNIQTLEEIENAVRDFAIEQQPDKNQVSVDVRALDKRLRLAECLGGLQTQWSAGSRTMGRVTVQVKCDSPVSWRVHVQATITIEGYVWSLENGAQRGDILSKSMLTKRKVVLGANNPAYASMGQPIVDIDKWLGYTFSQRVSAGKILDDRMLKRANLVNKGEKVLIRHQAAGLQLQTFGTALKGAASDQRIQVRNNSSGKIVEAVVVARGLVDVLY